MTNPNTNTETQLKKKISIPSASFPLISTNDSSGGDSYNANMEALSFSSSGFYPFTKMGLWHGGAHYTEAALSQFKTKHGVRCIADGELVAFRLDSKLIKDSLGKKYSSSFFLVRHKFEYPIGNKLTVFSLYMHTAPKGDYPSENKSTHITTRTANLRKGFSSKDELISKTALEAKTKLKIGKTTGNRSQILAINEKPVSGIQTIWVKAIKPLAKTGETTSRMKVTSDIPLDKVVVLPKPTPVKAGEQLGLLGEYNIKDQKKRKLLHLEVFTGDDVEAFAKKAKAELALNKKDAPSRNILYIAKGSPLSHPEDKKETIVHKTSGTYIRQAYSKTDPKYNDSPVLYPKGTILELGSKTEHDRTEVLKINGQAVEGVWTVHKNYYQTKTIKEFKSNGNKSAVEACFNIKDLKAPKTDTKGKKWWEVELLKNGIKTYGYVSEKHLTHGVSFPCAQFIDEPSKDGISIYNDVVAYFKGKFQPNEYDLRPEHQKLSGTLKSVFDKIDTNKDGELEAQELKQAINNKSLRQQLSRMVIKHPSEWKWTAGKWGQLDGIFSSDESIKKWDNEKARIEKLCFWKDIAGKVEGFPKSDTVWHMHPVWFVGNFLGGKIYNKEYIVDIIPKSKKHRSGKAMIPTSLTIHSTGNPTSVAKGERGWLTNPTNVRVASFHIVVDQNRAIECIPFTEVAWHAGDKTGNTTSIGLEICESGDRAATLENAIRLTAQILFDKGWDTSNLRMHNDWSGKNCPRILRTSSLRTAPHQSWDWFKQEVGRYL